MQARDAPDVAPLLQALNSKRRSHERKSPRSWRFTLAGIVFWVMPSVFAQGQSTFLLIVLAAVFGFATGIPASKKYDSLLADGSLESPTVRLFAQLGVLGAQLL